MKKFIVCLMIAAMVLSVAACAKKAEETTAAETTAAAAQLANPWVDCTLKDIQEKTGLDFGTPANAKDITYRLMESDKLGEMNFTVDGAKCCARVKAVGQAEDISGMYYTWDSNTTAESTVNGQARTYTVSKTKDGKAILCTWFDAVPGIQWSLSVTSDNDLGSFDITGLADQTFVNMQGEA